MSLLSLLQHLLTLEVVEPEGDSAAHHLLRILLLLLPSLFKLLVAEANEDVQLNGDQEEGDTLQHQRGQGCVHLVVHLDVLAQPDLYRVDNPNSFKADGLTPI